MLVQAHYMHGISLFIMILSRYQKAGREVVFYFILLYQLIKYINYRVLNVHDDVSSYGSENKLFYFIYFYFIFSLGECGLDMDWQLACRSDEF
jgi:hypothetical protein